jgi:hypothetical protein
LSILVSFRLLAGASTAVDLFFSVRGRSLLGSEPSNFDAMSLTPDLDRYR